jgi:hypothetical protein
MDHRWLKNGRTKEDVLRYKNAFDTLKEVLETEFKKKEAVRDYSPGWEYKQISHNEFNQALDDLIKFITLTKE